MPLMLMPLSLPPSSAPLSPPLLHRAHRANVLSVSLYTYSLYVYVQCLTVYMCVTPQYQVFQISRDRVLGET